MKVLAALWPEVSRGDKIYWWGVVCQDVSPSVVYQLCRLSTLFLLCQVL